MPLKLGNKPFVLHPESPSVDKVRAFLEKQPKDKLFTSDGPKDQSLSLHANISANTIRQANFSAKLPGYSLKVGRNRYFGSKPAILALRKQVGL